MRRVGILYVVGGLVLLAGCLSAKERVSHPDGEQAWEEAHGQQVGEDETVAVVDGRRLSRADLMLKWRENPQWTAQEALQALVEREVLVGQALREEVHLRPEVGFARKQGMVSALLEEQVEAKAKLDEEKRPQFVELVHKMRRAPAGLRASHLVILVPEEVEGEDGAQRKLTEEEREPLWEVARDRLEWARRELGPEADDDAFRAMEKRLNEEVLTGGLSAAVNEHLRFPRVDSPHTREQLPSGWTTVVREFAEGAQKMADGGELGKLSEPVRSSYGWHVIRVDEIFEERPVEVQAQEQFVEDQLVMEGQIQSLRQELGRWIKGARVETYPEHLEEKSGVEGF